MTPPDREDVDALVGRTSHLAAVAAEGNAYLPPMIAMVKASRRVAVKQAAPGGAVKRIRKRILPNKEASR